MASNQTIAGVLAFLHELFPTRDIGDRTLDAWRIVFGDWSDEEFTSCAHATAREPTRTFFPTPGEIAAHRPKSAINPDAILDRIAKLGEHNPHSGWIYPSFEKVRDELGEQVGRCYVDAGGDRCFASETNDGSHVSRDIARRYFAEEISRLNRLSPTGLQLPAQIALALPAQVPEERERIPFSERPEAEQQKLRFPKERTTTVASIEYLKAKRLFAEKLAETDEFRDAFFLCHATTEGDFNRRGFAANADVIRRHALIAFADRQGFADFHAWCKEQGIVCKDPRPIPRPEPAERPVETPEEVHAP